jgi:hypothetical protein
LNWIKCGESVALSDGASVGTVHVDPWAFGVSAGYCF